MTTPEETKDTTPEHEQLTPRAACLGEERAVCGSLQCAPDFPHHTLEAAPAPTKEQA